MAVVSLKNYADFLRSSLSLSLSWDLDGNISLLANNIWPNPYALDFDERGEADGWALRERLPEKIVAHHFNVTRPGVPKKTSLTRQTTSPVPVEEGGWKLDGPVVAGVRSRGKDPRKPAPPTVELAPTGVRGYEAGTYGVAYFFESIDGDTTTSGYRYFAMTNGQIPVLDVPESFPLGTVRWGIVLTKKGGGPAGAAIQRRVPLAELRGRSEYKLMGPWRNRGKAPTSNTSGLGVPKTPKVGRDVYETTSRLDMGAGRWTPFVQTKNARGPSVLSRLGGSVRIKGDPVEVEVQNPDGTTTRQTIEGPYKKNTGLFCRTPRVARRRDVEFTYWFLHEAPDGKVSTYRVYDVLKGKAAYFRGNPGFSGFTVHGYPEDETPRGVRYRMVEEEFPTEDLSVLEAPDPNGLPDAPRVEGVGTPPAGPYLVTATGVTESGALTQESEPTPITLPPASSGSTLSNFTLVASPQRTVNQLSNAEFSRLDAGGKPEDWTPVNCAPADSPTTSAGLYSVKDGVLTLSTQATTSAAPAFEPAKIPVSQTTVLSVSGRLAVDQIAAGTAGVVLREYDEAGVFLRDTVAAELSGIGDVPFFRSYGPGGTAYHASAAFVTLRPRMSGASVNMTMRVRDLAVFPFASDLRKVEFAASGSGEADNFDASASTPFGVSSFVAYGPPPTPPGTDLPEPEPPVEVVGFEGGAWPAGWEVTASGARSEFNAASAMHGALGWDTQDSSGTLEGVAFAVRTYPEMDGRSFALRRLLRVPQRPTHGFVNLMRVRNAARTRTFAVLRYYADGKLTVSVQLGLASAVEKTVASGVANGSTVDAEIIVAGALSKNGILSVGIGLNGAPRGIAYSLGGLDYSAEAATTAEVGVQGASDTRAKWHFHTDQVVVTKNGDVLNRERPPAPSGYVPPPPDSPRRPLIARAAKTAYAAGEERIPAPFGQAAYNGHAYEVATAGTSGPNPPAFPTGQGATVRDNAGISAVARSTAYALGASVLKPSGASTDAEWYEVTATTGTATTAATAPAYPTTEGATVLDGEVTLTTRKTVLWKESGTSYREFDPDGERIGQPYVFVAPGEGPVTLDLLERPIAVKPGMSYTDALFVRRNVFGGAAPGVKVWLEGDGKEPLLAASFGEMATRGWHPAGDEDDFVTYSVPPLEYEGEKLLPCYTRVRYEATLTEGVYVFQDPLHAQGLYANFASRDAKRGYGRATTGEITAILPTYPEAYRAGPDAGIFWSEFGVKPASDPTDAPGHSVSPFYSTSSDGILFGPERTSTDLAQGAHLRTRVVLTGDGRTGPTIPSGGIFLRTWTPLPVLLRADGSHFPGVALVGDLIYATTYPDAETDRVGGHHQTVELTDDITRFYDLAFGASTEAAMQGIDGASLSEELILELPKAGGEVAGVAYLIRLREQTGFGPEGRIMVRGGHREMRGMAKVKEAEVLEAAPLRGPRSLVAGGA